MSRIALSGNASGTGTLTIAAPNTSTDRTLTLPDNTGTIITTASTVSYPKGGPTFGASQTNAQTISRATFTKLQYNIEDWDTASCYDNATNYRFTPNVAGYYQVSARTQFNNDTAVRSETFISIYKNGSEYKRVTAAFGTPANTLSSPAGSMLVYLNGTTDYIEAYVYYGGGDASVALNASSVLNFFQAFLASAA